MLLLKIVMTTPIKLTVVVRRKCPARNCRITPPSPKLLQKILIRKKWPRCKHVFEKKYLKGEDEGQKNLVKLEEYSHFYCYRF